MSITLGNMPAADYHAIKALSSSGLKALGKSPAHYKFQMETPMEETPSMRLGTLVHKAILEPIDFENDVRVVHGNRNSNDVKDLIKTLVAQGCTVVKQEEYDTARAIRDAVITHPQAVELLANGMAEKSVLWTDSESGADCKARFDYVRPSDGIIIDIKTTQDASFDAVQKTIANYKYHWQSGLYLDALQASTGKKSNFFVHIFVENEAPYGVSVVMLDDASLEKARTQYKPLQKLYAKCVKEDQWPGYTRQIQTMNLPSWAW